MPTIEISCEETGTCVTLEMGEEHDGALTIITMSDDLATPQDARRFVRAWADAVEQEQFEKAPRALQHVLAVIKMWGRGAYDLLDATRRVAQAQGHSDDTTVRDAYTRRLGNLHVDDFYRLLKGDRFDLEEVLLRQYPEHFDVIESYMSYLTRGPI